MLGYSDGFYDSWSADDLTGQLAILGDVALTADQVQGIDGVAIHVGAERDGPLDDADVSTLASFGSEAALGEQAGQSLAYGVMARGIR